MPQNPRFPQSERVKTLRRATSLFRLHFPYTTVYPSLGNLDFYPHEEELVMGGTGGGGGGVAVVGVAGMLRTKQKDSEDTEGEEMDDEEEMLDGIKIIIQY